MCVFVMCCFACDNEATGSERWRAAKRREEGGAMDRERSRSKKREGVKELHSDKGYVRNKFL